MKTHLFVASLGWACALCLWLLAGLCLESQQYFLAWCLTAAGFACGAVVCSHERATYDEADTDT